jgi:hypothetical protein
MIRRSPVASILMSDVFESATQRAAEAGSSARD